MSIEQTEQTHPSLARERKLEEQNAQLRQLLVQWLGATESDWQSDTRYALAHRTRNALATTP